MILSSPRAKIKSVSLIVFTGRGAAGAAGFVAFFCRDARLCVTMNALGIGVVRVVHFASYTHCAWRAPAAAWCCNGGDVGTKQQPAKYRCVLIDEYLFKDAGIVKYLNNVPTAR